MEDLDSQVRYATGLVKDGADIIDVGGQWGGPHGEVITADEELSRVVPLIEQLVRRGFRVSVATWRHEVVEAAVEAGAVMINDVSGLADPAILPTVASSRVSLVLTDVGESSHEARLSPISQVARLRMLMTRATTAGVRNEQLIVDPGPDVGKTPAQTVESLRHLADLKALGRPILLSVSERPFLEAITGRSQASRVAATLAALAHGVSEGARVVCVHDVRAAITFLRATGTERRTL